MIQSNSKLYGLPIRRNPKLMIAFPFPDDSMMPGDFPKQPK